VAIAEYFRDKGNKVLFAMDSITRFARALREVGLAAGEPPTRRGYPPSVFAALPVLMERTGNSSAGSITAFYALLTEGAEEDDPVAEEVRSILDGHIILSRALAQQGQYPAVDVLPSVSRVMSSVTDQMHIDSARYLRSLLAKYNDVELLLQMGEYKKGVDAFTDTAVAAHPHLRTYLTQGAFDECTYEDARRSAIELAVALGAFK